MNSLSWMIGHLASQHERLVWARRGLGLTIEPILDGVANGAPASTPPLDELRSAWERVAAIADPLLDAFSAIDLTRPLTFDRRTDAPAAGTVVLRVICRAVGGASSVGGARTVGGASSVGAPELEGWRPKPSCA